MREIIVRIVKETSAVISDTENIIQEVVIISAKPYFSSTI